MSEPFPEVEEFEIAALPRWAAAAFAARCARRVLPVLQATGLAGREATERVLSRIDVCSRTAIPLSKGDMFRLIDEIDDLEVSYRCNDDRHHVACNVICSTKFAAFCASEYDPSDCYSSYRNAAQGACFSAKGDPDEAIVNSQVTYCQMRNDFETIVDRLARISIGDDSPFDFDGFGVVWPTSTPSWARGQSDWDGMK